MRLLLTTRQANESLLSLLCFKSVAFQCKGEISLCFGGFACPAGSALGDRQGGKNRLSGFPQYPITRLQLPPEQVLSSQRQNFAPNLCRPIFSEHIIDFRECDAQEVDLSPRKDSEGS
eukprot:2339221-Pleurochrysis_carterae.AAC.1